MASGLAKTLQLLTETQNEAALGVLLSLLDSSDESMRLAALRSLLDRRSEAGHRELLTRWHAFSDEWKSIVAERGTRLGGALRAAILCTDPTLHQNACDAVVYLHEYDLIPTLITAAEDKGNAQAELAACAVGNLCEQLYEELVAPRDYRKRRDPVLVRQYIYSALENALGRFEQHRRPELVEAFLLLAQADDSILKQLLRNQRDKIYATAIGLMSTSSRLGVMRLVLRYLDDPHAPAGIYTVLSRRRDVPFLQLVFKKVSQGISQHVRSNLRKIESFAWFREDMQALREFSDEELCGAVHLVMASGINRLRVFELLKFAMRNGRELSRRAASAALAQFKGGEANDMALSALEDPDPEVQANAVRQLRERGIPGVMPRLVDLVDSPHAVVREAARQSLTEFNFQRYLSAFEMLEPEVRRCSGALVKRVDPQALAELQTELESPSRTRRLRGVEVAVAMGAVRELEKYIVQLASDSDHFIRAEAARALVYANSERTRNLLRELLADRSVSVQEAAQQALQQLGIRATTASDSAPPFSPNFGLPDLPGTNPSEARP